MHKKVESSPIEEYDLLMERTKSLRIFNKLFNEKTEVVNMFEAAIFDMDGLIIDSEPFWKDAEKLIFGEIGIVVTDELALHTRSLTTVEVTQYWYNYHPWSSVSLTEVEQRVIEKVGQLIDSSGCAMPGVVETLAFFKERGYKIGLATNSPEVLMLKVLNKLCIRHYFDVVSSADNEVQGKPNPDIYLSTARKLGVMPEKCIAFEDSLSGLTAALNAGMKAVVVPEQVQFSDPAFERADLKLNCLNVFSDKHVTQLFSMSNRS